MLPLLRFSPVHRISLSMHLPRLVISGLSGGSGKTLLSLGLTRAFCLRGCRVQPAKKGPDYIDAAWLALAARRPAANLDPYFLPAEELPSALAGAALRFAPDGEVPELAVIEGNRGLYDGRDVLGSCSTAQVALALAAPVLLVLNCAKMTRTAAAVVAGVASFAPALRFAGVVLNNVGNPRHAVQVRQAVEYYTDIPVLGELPRLRENPLPERHMGLELSPASRNPHIRAEREHILNFLAAYAEEHIDLDVALKAASAAPELPAPELPAPRRAAVARPRIGFVRDDALWFYYEENLTALRDAGAELVELNLLDGSPWPELDGLYLGGGFPELFPDELSSSPRLNDIRALAESGRPVYAECGGFMLLCRALRLDGRDVPMSNLLPVATEFLPRPQGLGYVEASTEKETPFHPRGSSWRGHEFHYSRCVWDGPAPDFALALSPGVGMGRIGDKGRDGLIAGPCGNVFASYTHLFAPAVPHWAERFVAAAGNTAANRPHAPAGNDSSRKTGGA